MSTNPQLDITLRPSRVTLWAVLLVHGCAALAIMWSGIAFWMQILGVVVVTSMVSVWLRERSLSARRLVISDSAVTIINQHGQLQADLVGEVYLSTRLVVLPLKFAEKRQFLPLAWDCASDDDFRRLRALLARG